MPCDSGNSDWGSITTWRGGKAWEVGGSFKREGTDAHLWLIHVAVWQKSNQYYKAIILQLKINKMLKKTVKHSGIVARIYVRKLIFVSS